MADISSKTEQPKHCEIHEIEIKKENYEQTDEIQSSTSTSNLNDSIDNLGPKEKKSLDITEEIKAQSRRKLSAPFSISQNSRLNLEKYGYDPRVSYYSKLMCKGLFC